MTLDDIIKAFQQGKTVKYYRNREWIIAREIPIGDICNFNPEYWIIVHAPINITSIDELVTLHNKYLATLPDDIDDELHGTLRGLNEYGLKYFVEWLKSR